MATLVNPLSVTLGLSGLILLLTGWWQWRRPPRNINLFWGYRTAASMRTQERWDYAQKEGARAVMQAGGAFMGMAIPALFWGRQSLDGLLLAILLLLAGCVTVFGRVQYKLRKRFGP